MDLYNVPSFESQFQEMLKQVMPYMNMLPPPVRDSMINFIRVAYASGQVDAYQNSVKTIANVCVMSNIDYDNFATLFDNLVRSAASGSS